MHRREVVSQDPYVVFPGNTQGRHARELGPKGASVVTVEDGLVTSVEPVELDVVRWETCEVDATETNCGEDVLEVVSSRLAELAREPAVGCWPRECSFVVGLQLTPISLSVQNAG